MLLHFCLLQSRYIFLSPSVPNSFSGLAGTVGLCVALLNTETFFQLWRSDFFLMISGLSYYAVYFSMESFLCGSFISVYLSCSVNVY